MQNPSDPRTPSLGSLLRAARNTYVLAVRTPLAESGFDDLPRDGVYTISAIATGDISPAGLGGRLGISKQAVSQLLDALVLRGYVERSIDTVDRRRMRLALTDRGKDVAAICRLAIDRLERRIAEMVGEEFIQHTRRTLEALITLASKPDFSLRAVEEP